MFSLFFHTAFFVSQEVALGTPPGFEKLKHVLEIHTFCFAEEMSGCVSLLTNAIDMLVIYLRRVLSQKHFETNFLLKFLFNLGCSVSKKKLMYTTLSELLTVWVINKSL